MDWAIHNEGDYLIECDGDSLLRAAAIDTSKKEFAIRPGRP
jgi:hypothetical protein